MLYEVITKQEKGAYGFDASKDQYCDMVKAGIIDPTKVVRSALQNAASVSGLMLTTEACIAEAPRITSYNVCYTKLLRPNAIILRIN